MITSLKFNNCFAFNNPIEMNLRADMRTKKFVSNIININENLNVLKSAVIYGPNNTGKTTLINCVKAIKMTLENKDIRLDSNIFTNSSICDAGMSFIHENKEYSYEFKFDCEKHLYLYEKMVEMSYDQYRNETEQLIFIKDTINNHYECPSDKELERVLNIASNNNILIYTVQIEKFNILQKIKDILTSASNSLVIVDMNRVPNSKTIEMLKNKDKETEKIVSFIKNADIYLDDYKYEESLEFGIDGKEADDKILKDQSFIDQIRLISVYKGKAVPSIIFDSLGTRKIVALASYIISAIEEGKTLIIDELDSSLHFKITRAIISMFNNEINTKAQLIATLHDISLLDCKKMFRKEQIWFTNKDEIGTELYSLKEFTYAENGIRETSDIKEKYSKGEFGAIPDPDLISALLEESINEEM
jgi:AAA15 family ATPase/GTPase